MTDELHHDSPEEPTLDESFTWTTGDSTHDEHADAGGGASTGSTGSSGSSAGTTATAILESIRDAVDDLAERASPTVREFSARAAIFAADAADKAAPYVKRAGEATADAGGKLASKSRTWAAEVRASIPTADTDAPHAAGSTPDADATPPPPAAEADNGSSDSAAPA